MTELNGRAPCCSVLGSGTPLDRDRPLVDVRDMIVVHTAMLREFRLASSAVRRSTNGDRARARRVAAHLQLICDLLHHHHQGEDDLLWPTMQPRLEPEALQAIEAVETQHEGIEAALAAVGESRADWVATPDEIRRERLADALDHLHMLLKDHLDTEERAVLPLAAMVLTEQEWRAVGEAGAAAIPRSVMPLVFGMFAYEGDPAVLADMLTSAPLPVRILVPRIAPRVYARRARQIHGTARP